MSLKDILQGDTEVRNIKIKVISKQGGNAIVGDASGVAICVASNNAFTHLVEGQCYQILKPKMKDLNFIIPNEKLKPIKIENFTLTPKKSEIAKLNILLQSNSVGQPKTENITSRPSTFQDILDLPPKTEIKMVTVKIINISKDINGTYGTYNIGKIKDIAGNKLDINLYNKQLKNKLQLGDIFDLRNVKLLEYVKDGETFKRLATTSRSSGKRASSEVEALFKDIPLGDKKEEGKVVAIHDIFSYLSCSKCWKKTDEEEEICLCGNKENIHIKDFHFQIYIETANDIEVVHTFRRQTNIAVDSIIHEAIQKTLEDKFLHKTFLFEWNINTEKEESIMIDIKESDH